MASGNGADDDTASMAWHGPAPVLRDDLSKGARVGRYVLEDELGVGGMGVVYRARDPELGRVLAVKLVKPRLAGSQGRARLLREAQALARLHHPNVVPVFDVGAVGDQVFVVMPYLAGGTLGQWMRARPWPRPWTEVLDRFVAAARGLAAAHAAGLVHRDFKPANVLLGTDGEVQVADFGLARLDHELDPAAAPEPAGGPTAGELTRTGTILGTPAYMAPEQLDGQPSDARADQFSFCVALWEALYGERPFDAGEAGGAGALVALLEAITAGRVAAAPSSSEVPPWLRAVLLRGLRADPAARWPSMKTLIAELDRRRSGRRLWPLAIAAIAAAAITGIAIALMSPDPPSAPVEVTVTPTRTRTERVTSRGDVTRAVLSPDGGRLAMLAGESLVVRGVEAGAAERVLLDSGPLSGLSWSPDGTRLLLSFAGSDYGAAVLVVDPATGGTEEVGLDAGIAGFVRNDEIAVADANGRTISLYSLSNLATPRAVCNLPGDHEWLRRISSALGGELLVIAVSSEARGTWLVILDRRCRHRGTITAQTGIRGHAVLAGGTILTDDGAQPGEIVEWSAEGTELRRRPISRGEEMMLVDSHLGRDYYLTEGTESVILRRATDGTISNELTSVGAVTLSISPSQISVATIEKGSSGTGPLRVTQVDYIGRRPIATLTGASWASWSPDGRAIAVTLRDQRGEALAILDPIDEPPSQRIDLGEIPVRGAPIWLDDDRVAFQRSDNRGYQWIALESGERGEVVDPRQGWAFNLERSPIDGTLALSWNPTETDPGLWLFPPGAPPARSKLRLTPEELFRWSRRGDLLVFDRKSGVIDRGDLATGGRESLASIALQPTQWLADVQELERDQLMITVMRRVGDVAVTIPE